MKLSDVKGERVFDVIADIIDPICNIASDKEITALFKRGKLPEGMTATEYGVMRVKKAVPPLLRTHKADVIAILAAVEGVSPEKYAEGLDLMKLMRDCTELLTDSAFTGLFTSAQSGNSSGSAQENTGAAGA